MADILCIYYSRTGKTRSVMAEIASSLDAELVEITDGVNRAGLIGAVKSCLDAVRKSTRFLEHFHTEKDLKDYDLVIIGTPVWAGRCSSIVREFLKKYGRDLERVAYVITRTDEKNHQEQVFDQMDLYTAAPRLCAASIRAGDVGEAFWREEFLKELSRARSRE